jgi:hypothetical protein
MNAQEVGKLIGLLASRYPNAKLGEDEELTIQAWTITLEDVPAEPHMALALREWFMDRRYPPDASELRKVALELGGPTPAMEARAERERACREHWYMLRGDPTLSDEDRRRLQREFRRSLELPMSGEGPQLRAIAGGR